MSARIAGWFCCDLAFVLSVLVYVGCTDRSARREAPNKPTSEPDAIAPGDDAVVAGDGAVVRLGELYGKYFASDYASCSREAPQVVQDWAMEQLDNEAAVLPEVFAMRGIVVLRPRYELRRHEAPVEGEVPLGRRRLLSDFHGMRTKTGRVTVLVVYGPGASDSRCGVEVIDANTLWDTWDGAHVLQWRREGTGKHPIPLKQRVLRYDGNGKTE